MEIFRTKRPEIIKIIYPYLIEAPDYTKEIIAEQIALEMIKTPDNICLVIAIEGDKLIGFSATWIVRNHAWIDQTWIDSNYDKEIGKEFLEQIKIWAIDKGLTDIRFETSRSAEAFSKAWGFEIFSSIMRMEL